MEFSKNRTRAAWALALVATGFLVYTWGAPLDWGWLVFLVPVFLFGFLIMAENLIDIAELIWKIVAKPEERLHSAISLGFTVFILVALYSGYRLVEGSIGMTTTVLLGAVTYLIFAVVRWFRRHTAAYYAALEAEKGDGDVV